MKNLQWKEGDILESENGYLVSVHRDEEGLHGALICDVWDSCRNIPYSLDGKHKLIWRRK